MKRNRELKGRVVKFALRIIKLYGALPESTQAQVIGKQVLKAGTSVGAHYSEGERAKSDADFINKMEGALQELQETDYWLELLTASGILLETRCDRSERRPTNSSQSLLRLWLRSKLAPIPSTTLQTDFHPSAFLLHL